MKKILAPCSNGCPVNTDIPSYIDAILRGDYSRAYQVIREQNPFPAVCGWVCPHPCEDNCRRGEVDDPLNIRVLKRFAVEQGSSEEVKEEVVNFPVLEDTGVPGGDVAVIGGGPSGLTAAYELAGRGYSVTVLDKNKHPGGHFYTSIPLYRLPREIISRDVQVIQNNGVDIICGVEAGIDIGMEELKRKFRVLVIAAGLQESKMLPIPGGDHPAVLPALTFLRGANLGSPVSTGENVIVIGGGDVAMDVARTALRQGTITVKLTCLESEEEMPAHDWEVEEAREEGVEIYTRWGPKEISIKDENSITGLKLQKVTRVFDEEGRFNPQFDENVTEFIEGDNVIVSIGQAPALGFLEDFLELDERGNIKVNRETMQTSKKDVFACGEVAEGPGAAISAIASGRRVAEKVIAYLQEDTDTNKEEQVELLQEIPGYVKEKIVTAGRNEPQKVSPEERRQNFKAFEESLEEEKALQEAGRCLRCGLGAEVDITKCIACLTCMRVCPFGVPAVESKAHISPDICQSCGICAAACPARAINIRGFSGPGSVYESVKVPHIKIYLCRRVMGDVLLPGFEKEIEGMDDAGVEVLPCTGALSSERVLSDFENGANGVVLVSCAKKCTAEGIAYYLENEYNYARNILKNIGIESSRLAHFTAENRKDIVEKLAAFAGEVKNAGKLWR